MSWVDFGPGVVCSPNTAAAYRARYQAFGDGIRLSSNPGMLYGVWSAFFGYSWKWASDVGAHYWRIGDDIYDGWQSLMRMWDTLQSIPDIAHRTQPGAYTFLDQTLIGDVPGKLQVHVGLEILADVRRTRRPMPPFSKKKNQK